MKRGMVTLKQESDAYLTIRNQFFATFQRVVLKSIPNKDKVTSPEGNNSAHGGDSLVDARLLMRNYMRNTPDSMMMCLCICTVQLGRERNPTTEVAKSL